MNPYHVVERFERALCDYTGAKYAVTVTSCTMALLLACRYEKWKAEQEAGYNLFPAILIPKRTYVSVPMSIRHAGFEVGFRDSRWEGMYQLDPYNIWDSARWFTSGLFERVPDYVDEHKYICVSFHWTKTLAIGQGGAILHNDDAADEWFRRMRFDGRREGVAPKDDYFDLLGYHCYMSPRDAAEGLSRLAVLPKDNMPLAHDAYPDLSTMEIFS